MSLADGLVRAVITAGGLGTILAVGLVCLFLVWVVLPLLTGADLAAVAEQPLPATAKDRASRFVLDERGRVGIAVHDSGAVAAIGLADGRATAARVAFDGTVARACAEHHGRLLLGRRDGGLQSVTVRLRSSRVEAAALPAALQELEPAKPRLCGDAFYELTPAAEVRKLELEVEQGDVLTCGSRPVVLADCSELPGGPVFAALDDASVLHLRALTERENLLTGAVERSSRGGDLPLGSLGGSTGAAAPDHLLLAGPGSALLLWRDGRLVRLDTNELEAPRVAEQLDLLPENGAQVTAVALLIGDTTLLVGDSLGRVQAWFAARPDEAQVGERFVCARVFGGEGADAVTALAVSQRSRLFAAGYASGRVRVFHGTSGRLVAEARASTGPVSALCIAPREDGLAAFAGGRIASWALDPGHPEVTLASIFLPVWYEGYPRSEHVWQSTSGSDAFEPKFGLWPLVFGTLKATFYCLLFGVPLALLAAIYTSEFLRARARARVKPLIEMMASLPSVVLGFLAALVFAPLVEAHLCSVLATMFCVPLAWLLGAQVWQALPHDRRIQAERWRLPCCFLTLPLGGLLAWTAGPALEGQLFGGSLQAWLDQAPGSATRTASSAFGGWFLLLLPLGALAGSIAAGLVPHGKALDRAGLRFCLGLAACLALSAAAAAALAAIGLDLRGALVGTYVQRNSLVVGFVMGFAVIPIVYTIAEDAFTAVPEHLRAASLGAGATPWQTAVRIVLPTAMSGVFSAVMVGLGRAVGETMIVLMATGNTPVLDLNPFNGFRTLSANIAVELPEAVRDSTHYRMLFLAAFCLFAMTFTLNTAAEVVRQRFRRRAFQL